MLITYETISTVYRSEKQEQLQKLPEDFFNSVKEWILSKRSNTDTNSLIEVQNVKKIVDEIINMRQKKIILSSLRTIRGSLPPKNLTESEQMLFDRIVELLKKDKTEIKEKVLSYDEIMEQKLQEVKEAIDDINAKKTMIKILSDIPEFVGSDMKKYGPLSKGDVAHVPDEIVDLLVSRKVAEKLLD